MAQSPRLAPEYGSLSFRTPSLFLIPFGALPSIIYNYTDGPAKSSLVTDILALSFSHNALSLLKIDSFKTGTILLSGMFLCQSTHLSRRLTLFYLYRFIPLRYLVGIRDRSCMSTLSLTSRAIPSMTLLRWSKWLRISISPSSCYGPNRSYSPPLKASPC